MIPLIPTLALSILALFSSAFSIVRILVPLIPNSRIHPRSRIRRAAYLSHADKAHLWLSGFDIIALAIFNWEVFDENLARHTDLNIAKDSAASARLLLSLTLRQTCLLVICAVAILQIRPAGQFSFGSFHWIVWVPTFVVTAISTTIAGIMASIGVESFHIGVASYTVATAAVCTLTIAYLVASLHVIRRNLSSYSQQDGSWQHAVRSSYSFATNDIEAIKDGSSWITSDDGSCHETISSFSFESTDCSVHTTRNVNAKREASENSQQDSSWLTEPSISPPTMTDWSFPATYTGSGAPASTTLDVHTRLYGGPMSYPVTPALYCAQCIGFPDCNHFGVDDVSVKERFCAFNRTLAKSIDVPWPCAAGWLAYIWLPLSLALPHIVATSCGPASVLFILSITISAPILSVNIAFSPLPIPSALLEDVSNLPKPSELEAGHKRSGSITVVEGRRSGDVWLSKGDAFVRKNKLSRAASLLSSLPKLSVLPVKPTDSQSDHRSRTLHCTLLGNSIATSAFVAVESYHGNEIGQLCYSNATDNQRVACMDPVFPVGHDFSARSGTSMISLLATSPVPISRCSSTNSRSSKDKRLHSGPFTTNLGGAILDVSSSTPQWRAQNSMRATCLTEQAIDDVPVCKIQSSRIPRSVQSSLTAESSGAATGGVSQKVGHGASAYSSHVVFGEGTSRRCRHSMIPVPIRLREADVAHAIEHAAPRSDAGRDNWFSELHVPPLALPSRLARSVSEKKTLIIRSNLE